MTDARKEKPVLRKSAPNVLWTVVVVTGMSAKEVQIIFLLI